MRPGRLSLPGGPGPPAPKTPTPPVKSTRHVSRSSPREVQSSPYIKGSPWEVLEDESLDCTVVEIPETWLVVERGNAYGWMGQGR